MNAFALFGLGDEELARLIYLLAVLVLVAGGARMARGRLGQTARQAATWLGIVAVLVVIYTYRAPLMRFVDPVLSELDPGRTAVVIDAEGTERLVYARSADGHFHIDAKVNGVGVDFLVDTGATTSVLSHDDAVRVGINTDALSYDRPVQTANGVAFTASARVDELRIGPFAVRNLRLGVMQDGKLSGSLLGLNVLNRFARLEVSGDRLTLTPSER